MNVKTATMQELLAAYNAANPAKPVKKFADRKTAERRVAALNGNGAAKPAKTKAAKPAKTTEHATRSEAIAASWSNKKVKAARSIKNKVRVGGEVYRSVLEAFTRLKLDVKKHIKFRALLKAQNRATFEGHVFTIVTDEL